MSPDPAIETAGGKSYGQILKSSALIGGSSVINIALGIVRTKVLALLLGPSGVGLLGLYGSISDLARNIAGMGISNSGVRQIAEAASTEDSQRIARTVTTLRKVALLLGIVGALGLLALSRPVAKLSFGDSQHTGSVAMLSLAVFFGAVAGGQAALVQGMRRIGDLARMSVLGGLLGTAFSIPLVYWLGVRGVVPFLVAVSGMSIIVCWWYARKIKVERVVLSWGEVAGEASALLKLGFVFMSVALMTMGAAYVVRVIVVRQIGVEAAGFYQAAWTLAGLYVGFILQAMGADFFPRLTAVANDNAECNRLVNEQAEIGLLLAGPGILATLTFAPLVITLFYSNKFGPAIGLLRWNCLGMLLRVGTWPMGFMLLAKNERGLCFITELLSNVVYLVLVWLGVSAFGLAGTGIAFFGLYVFYWALMFTVVRRLSGFAWSPANVRMGLVFGPLIAATFVGEYWLPQVASVLLGTAATLLAGLISLRALCTLIALERLPNIVQRVLTLLKLTPAKANV
jgi:PST family polysaccharide transporter